MRKSVFIRYMTVFMLIIFISFSVLALVISSNMSMMTLNNKRDLAERSAKNVADIMMVVCRPTDEEDFRAELTDKNVTTSEYIRYLSGFSEDLRLFVFSGSGELLISYKEEYGGLMFRSGLTPAQLEKIKTDGGLEGYDTLDGVLGDRYLYHIVPIYDITGTQVVGCAMACSSARGLNALIVSTVKTIILASLWVFLAALIAVYFLSDRIISPLKEMSVAAKSYAAGKFDVRVPVRGEDEIAELAVALNQMATGLESLENMRQSFLANVSHDLKTPMTTISGFIDGILSGAIPPENEHEYLERIKSEVLRLSRLVRQLLDLSRIQAGDRKFEPVTFDICEVARQIVLSFEQKIDEKRLDVEFECEEDRMKVVADKDAIHQILYNICDNAVKFSREGGKYRIDIRRKDKKVHVSVYNEGEGIAEEDLPFVFERFYKSDKSRGLDKTGVGLGLYIAKTIIDAHGETITVDSVRGEYCKFEFTLAQGK